MAVRRLSLSLLAYSFEWTWYRFLLLPFIHTFNDMFFPPLKQHWSTFPSSPSVCGRVGGLSRFPPPLPPSPSPSPPPSLLLLLPLSAPLLRQIMQVEGGGALASVAALSFPVVEGRHTSVRRMWENASLLDWLLASAVYQVSFNCYR